MSLPHPPASLSAGAPVAVPRHGRDINTLPDDTLDLILHRPDWDDALATALAVLPVRASTWMVATSPKGGPLVMAFTGDDTYYRHQFHRTYRNWPVKGYATNSDEEPTREDLIIRHNHLVDSIENLLMRPRSVSADLTTDDPLIRATPAALIPLLDHWWEQRIAAGANPHTARFVLSMFLPPATLALLAMPDLTAADGLGADGIHALDEAFWLNPARSMSTDLHALITPPPATPLSAPLAPSPLPR